MGLRRQSRRILHMSLSISLLRASSPLAAAMTDHIHRFAPSRRGNVGECS